METVVAVVLLAILAVSIIGLNGQLFMGSAHMRQLQIGTQLQQACVEQVLAQRKSAGYATTFSCTSLNAQGFTLSATDAATVQYCPTGMQCRQITVSVAGNGITPAAATLLFVNY
jgi:Tfp pilus assembly protein PilV